MFKKLIVILCLCFTLCFNSVFAKCSVSDDCAKNVNNITFSSDCMSGNKFATVEQAFERYLANKEHPDYSEYTYEMILSRECPGNYCYADTRYYVYKSIEPIYYDSSSSRYIFPAKTFIGEVVTIEDKGYAITKNACIGSSFCVPNFNSSQTWESSLPGEIISLNYDLCDTNGNVVHGTLLSDGYIEITLPEHTGDSCVIAGNNEVVLSCSYSYTNFFNTPPYIEIFGVDNYEYIDSSFEISADMGNISGMGTWLFTLPYNTKTKVGVCFYDDLNNYYEDFIYITCYENSEDVPPDTDIDFEVNSGGSGSDSGGSGSGLSGISNFFSELSGIFSDIGEFFIGFSKFISNSFSFLPTEINLVLGVGILLVILLRIFGR